MKRDKLIKQTKKVVIKIGTRVITHHDGTLDLKQIEKLVRQIALLKDNGLQVIVVTSGSIGAGIAQLGLKKRPRDISQLQSCAAVGQSQLMHTYAELFKRRGFVVAQILLTAEDLRHRVRHLNARNTLFSLLERNVIPIVNENDTVVVDEIRFGDNDRLSALVTNLIQADLLVILTDVDGLYQPLSEGKVKHVDSVSRITKEVENWCTKSNGGLGTGGMISKLESVKLVTRTGEGAVIANGRKKDVILDILQGIDVGTYFAPSGSKLASRKRWLAFFTKPHGTLIIDKGAREALVTKGKSLLAIGITGVKGEFKTGDVVVIADNSGNEFARGLVNYNKDEVDKIKGLRTTEIQNVLQYKTYDEVIHCNNIAMI